VLRFGIIGAGNIARTHANAIRQIADAELVSVAGGDTARGFAEQFACAHHDRPDDLIDNPDVDAVILCTPSGVRLEYTVAAARRGKHVLVEKPIEVSYGRALAMIDACERHGVTLGVVYQSRFKPHCQALRSALERGSLGDLVLGDAYVKWHRPLEYYQSAAWRGTREFDGGGALINQAIHYVDLLLWFLGDVTAVNAKAANRLHHGIEVEDTIVAQLEFENGGLGVVEATTAAFPGSSRRIEIHGTAGSAALVDDLVSEWEFRDGSEPPPSPGKAGTGAARSTHVVDDFEWHRLQIEDFVSAVEADRVPLVDGREGLRSLELVLAIYDSAARGRRVELRDFRASATS
jgi:UDP-N-acetyl-2-amino-2-deoxyglucuronate dehydrogenase